MAAEEAEREGGALRRREEPAAHRARKEPGSLNRSALPLDRRFPAAYVTIGQLLVFPGQSRLTGRGGVQMDGPTANYRRETGRTQREIKGLALL